MKLLLYCTKAMPRLVYRQIPRTLMELDNSFEGFMCGTLKEVGINEHGECELLNGKIVAECDFEVEEICSEKLDNGVGYEPLFYTETIDDISKKSCLTQFEIENYLSCKAGGEVVGYAIHIKNLHIFEKPKDLRNYYTNRIYTKIEDVYTDEIQIKSSEWVRPIKNAPQNMMYAFTTREDKDILISIKPEWLCKILNGEKTIEVRKKVLKEML